MNISNMPKYKMIYNKLLVLDLDFAKKVKAFYPYGDNSIWCVVQDEKFVNHFFKVEIKEERVYKQEITKQDIINKYSCEEMD